MSHRGRSSGKFARCTAWAALAVAASGALAQSGVLLSPLGPSDEMELRQWGQRLLTRLDTGQPAADAAGFAFTSPVLNGPLFSPVLAAVRGVADYTDQPISLCDQPESPVGPGEGMGVNLLRTTQSVRDYLAHGRVSTSLYDAAASFAHLQAIFSAPVSVTVTVEGEELVSEGLPPPPQQGVVQEQEDGLGSGAQYASVNADTLAWVTQLRSAAIDLAAVQNLSHIAADRLVGLPRAEDAYGEAVGTYSADILARPLAVYVVYAVFGTYGALPVLVCIYDDFSANQGDDHRSFMLIDAVNGTLDGPFVAGSVIDPSNLLSGHVEADGMGAGQYVLVNGSGCPSEGHPTVVTFVACATCAACQAIKQATCAGMCCCGQYWDTPGEGTSSCYGKCMSSPTMAYDLTCAAACATCGIRLLPRLLPAEAPPP